jgi:benzoate-CoA ligase
MTPGAPILLPDQFNAATYFIDRHIYEGRGEKIAIEAGGVRVSYRQLWESVNRFGNALRGLRVRIEERVFLLLLDTPEFAFNFFGAIKIGAVPVPVNTLLKTSDYHYILNNSRARVAVVSEALYAQLQGWETLRYLQHIIVVGGAPQAAVEKETQCFADLIECSSPQLEAEPTSKDDAASGVIVRFHPFPKAASICSTTWWSARTPCQGVPRHDRIRPLFAWPSSSSPWFGQALYFPLAVALPASVAGPPGRSTYSEIIERHLPSLFFSVPSNYAALLAPQKRPRGRTPSSVLSRQLDFPDFDLSSIRYRIHDEALPQRCSIASRTLRRRNS